MIRKLKIYKNIPTKQSSDILKTFPKLLEIGKFERILEIGTYCGGLSLLVTELAPDAEYLGYEIDGSVVHPKVTHLVKVTDFIKDLDHIRNFIQRKGRCLVLCDGGNKHMEFTILSPLLKHKDVIMTHDYLNDQIHDVSVYREVEGFRNPETTKTMLQGVADSHNLVDNCAVDLTYSLWSYWTKVLKA